MMNIVYTRQWTKMLLQFNWSKGASERWRCSLSSPYRAEGSLMWLYKHIWKDATDSFLLPLLLTLSLIIAKWYIAHVTETIKINLEFGAGRIDMYENILLYVCVFDNIKRTRFIAYDATSQLFFCQCQTWHCFASSNKSVDII